jgi:hypothetical protein
VQVAFALPGALLFLSFVGLLFYFSRRVIMGAAAASSEPAASLLVDSGDAPSLQASLAVASVVLSGFFGGTESSPWLSVVGDVMLADRQAQMGYPMLLVVLLLLWAAMNARASIALTTYAQVLVCAGVCAGSLPLVQVRRDGVPVYCGVCCVCVCACVCAC